MAKRLTISGNGRYFQEDGRPFFWLGDTAWLLFQKLRDGEIETYLRNRADKGFTVIQATLVHVGGMANPIGSPALLGDDDFARPNPDGAAGAYWPGVRRAVEYAASLGLYMALLPAWGSLVQGGTLTAANAAAYTDFLAGQFGGYENVIWLVGGDVRGSDAPEVFDLIGRELRRKCPDHLIGFHPFGRCASSMWFHDSPWLDFNMFQSGHRDYTQRRLNAWDDAVTDEEWMGEDNYRYVLRDRARMPAKPTLDGEPSYELIPHGLHDSAKPYWQACDVRRYAYWPLLAGAAGHTYGDNAVMQFYRGGDKAAFGALQTWDVALHNPGGMQMGHARRLMEAIGWHEGEPCQEMLLNNVDEGHAHLRAMRTPCAACCYAYEGQPMEVELGTLGFGRVEAFWFDPVIGGISTIGLYGAAGAMRFVPPERCRGTEPKIPGQNDWVLVLVAAEHAEAFRKRMK